MKYYIYSFFHCDISGVLELFFISDIAEDGTIEYTKDENCAREFLYISLVLEMVNLAKEVSGVRHYCKKAFSEKQLINRMIGAAKEI